MTIPPPSNTQRWGSFRKAQIVAAVRGGLHSLEEACSRYALTIDELLSWQSSFDKKRGLAGLAYYACSAIPAVGSSHALCTRVRERLFYGYLTS